jgi:glutathione peroxidase
LILELLAQTQKTPEQTFSHTIFDFTVKDHDGNDVPLSDYNGKAKAFLITNVNSVCHSTRHQFEMLNSLHRRWYDRGLIIIGFPCSQFGNLEEDDSHKAYKGELLFELLDRVDVNGPTAHELFKYLKHLTGKLEVRWNFHKWLLAADGTPRYRLDEDYPVELLHQHIHELISPERSLEPWSGGESRRRELRAANLRSGDGDGEEGHEGEAGGNQLQ